MQTNTVPGLAIPAGMRKTLTLIAIGTLLLGVVYFFLFRAEEGNTHQSPKTYFVLYVAPFIYLIAIIYSIVKVLRKMPVIRIDSNGVWWKVEMGSEHFFVSWKEVQGFEPNALGFMNKAIRVKVTEPERYLSNKLSLRKGQEAMIRKYGTHLAIPINLIDMSPEELLSILQNYQDVMQGKPGAKLLPRMEL